MVVAGLWLGSAGDARAASWDPVPGTGAGDGAVSGGSGNWDNFSPYWTNDGGATNVNWANAGGVAVFGGASGGTVTIVGGGVTANSLTFDVPANLVPYTIASQGPGDVLTLAAGATMAANANATIAAVVNAPGGLSINGAGGGALAFTNFGNTIAGPVTLSGGGAATFAHPVSAGAGQSFSATAGTLTLGGSAPGAVVSLGAGSLVQASGAGVVQVFGRAAGVGTGVTVGGTLEALGGGRVEVGDGLDDGSQVAFAGGSQLTADGGTVVLRPRGAGLVLDGSTTGAVAVRNGGVLAMGAGSSGDLVLDRDVDEAGAWTLANRAAGGTFRITGASQNSTAGLTLRGEAGVLRYEVDAITLGSAAANGVVNVELRGGTVDINNAAAGKTFSYAPGYVVSGWGQIGTSAANQTHVIAAGGTTFYANTPGAAAGTLSVVGGFNESAGGKAQFRVGDNDGLLITVPNADVAGAYVVGGVAVDPQGAGSVARFGVGGGFVRADRSVFGATNNRLKLEVGGGGTLVSDIADAGTLLVNTPGSVAIEVSGGGTFGTTSQAYTLGANETVGGTGTLFQQVGAAPTSLLLRGLVDLNGRIGGTIVGASNGTLKLDAGESLTLGGAADLSGMRLAFDGGAAAPALLEVNAPAALVRLGTGAPVTVAGGFGGTREFRVAAGTFQVDQVGTNGATITGVNQLVVQRGVNSLPGDLVGTLTLAGGGFQLGAGANTNKVAPGGVLEGFGTFGHAGNIDLMINSGTVRAVGGPLVVSAGEIQGSGTYDPNGQTLTLGGAIRNNAQVTSLRIAGSNGGFVHLGPAGNYTGGTVVDGSAGFTVDGGGVVTPLPIVLRATAASSLGTGPVTLNTAGLLLQSQGALNFGALPVTLAGTNASTIQYSTFTGGGPTHQVGKVTIDGQRLNLVGQTIAGSSATLQMNGVEVGPGGGQIVSTSGAPVRTGAVTLNGALALGTSSLDFRLGALSGAGSIARTTQTGTIRLVGAASGFTGMFTSSVGTTQFDVANALSGGRFQFGVGTVGAAVILNAAGALSGASGTMTAGTLEPRPAGALDGAYLNLTGGLITATNGGSLGTGTVQLSGGELILRNNAATAFGGSILAARPGTGTTGVLTVDRASAAGAGGAHTVQSITIDGQVLRVQSRADGLYGLGVATAVTASGTTGGTLDNEMNGFVTPLVQLNGGLTITGSGSATVGQLGGTGPLRVDAINGTVTLTGASAAGFASAVRLTGGTVNVNNAASFAGGTVQVDGGFLNLGVANALQDTPVSLASGFVSANVANALAGKVIPMTNGTLLSTATGALTGATVNATGGNVTATAPGALAGATVNLTDAILALRNNAPTAFGGSVVIGGTNFSTVSVADVDDTGALGNRLSIDNLTFGGQTLNVTGGYDAVFTVINPITLVGSAPTTVNTTAADALFQGALTGAGALVKNGQRTLTLDGGASVASTAVNAGTLVVNGAFNSGGATVGGAAGPAVLQLGGGGVNAPGNVTVNSGTLRIAKANPANALPANTEIVGGTNGDVTVEYAGLTAGTLAKTITILTGGAARTLTLSAASGTAAGQVSTFTYSGAIAKVGANALSVVARADSALDDGAGNLVRPASRMVLGGSYAFPVAHGGGIVVGKGSVAASGNSPLGTAATIALNVMDSTVGGTVADGQTSADFARPVTTAANGAAPRARLGAIFNPAGSQAAAQTINLVSGMSFQWNDATLPLYVIRPAGNPAGGAAAASLWNGVLVDAGTTMVVQPGAQLDNIVTATASAVTSAAPVYVGGGGTLRFAQNFNEGTYRSLAAARGLAGQVVVLDNTTVQSQTTGHHFDGVELRTGTYRTDTFGPQTLAGGFVVSASPFDAARTTSTLVTNADLSLTGTGAANAFRVGAAQTLVKSGGSTLNVSAEQLHGAGATLQVTQGTVNVNSDGGGTAAANNLSISATGGTVNLNANQHLAQVTVGGAATVRIGSAAPAGARVLETTGVLASGGGRLDVTNGRLIVDYAPGNSPITSVRQQIVAAYNAGGPLWGGSGITSTTAAAQPTVFGVGYGEASSVVGAGGGTFGSEAVDGSAVVVRYTRLGDATLDGLVDFNDLVRLAQNYDSTTGSMLWSQGDFTYDGVVDFNDLVRLAQNYETALAGEPVPAGLAAASAFGEDMQLAFAMAQTPEPGAVGLLAAAVGYGLARRRRRQ